MHPDAYDPDTEYEREGQRENYDADPTAPLIGPTEPAPAEFAPLPW